MYKLLVLVVWCVAVVVVVMVVVRRGCGIGGDGVVVLKLFVVMRIATCVRGHRQQLLVFTSAASGRLEFVRVNDAISSLYIKHAH